MKITCRTCTIENLSKKDGIRKKKVSNCEFIVDHPLELPLRKGHQILFISKHTSGRLYPFSHRIIKIYEADTVENAKQIIKDLKRAFKLNIKEVAVRDNQVRIVDTHPIEKRYYEMLQFDLD